MMKFPNAALIVKHIKGKNGTFSVGDLFTDIGVFKTKDAVLDQFEEGNYRVDAWIDQVYLGQYFAYGRAVTEIRARLHGLQVIEEQQRPAQAEPQDIDPMDEQPAIPSLPTKAEVEQFKPEQPAKNARWDKFKKKSKPEALTPQPDAPQGARLEESLYDDETLVAIERLQPVKLDPTVDRALLRRQTAGLKERGYRFDSRQQTWFANANEPALA